MSAERQGVKKQKRAPAIRGICRAAAELGVTREHLWMVLARDRKSRRLKARYAEWKKAQEGAAA